MAVISGFFNAMQDGSGKRDRVYSAEDFGAIFDGIISDGIFEKYLDHFNVTTSGTTPTGHLEVIVEPGRAWFNQTWTLIDADYTVNTISSRDTVKHRIDGIYLKIDKDSRANSIYVSEGDEDPVAPVLKVPTDVPDHVNYYLLATIYVHANLNDVDSPITSDEITVMIGKDGGAPYAKSLVTDTSVTVDSILSNLDKEFEKYQSNYSDQFWDWFEDIRENVGEITDDQIIQIAEMVANLYSADYLSGVYPYVEDNCLHLSSEKSIPPPVFINFGFVSGSMQPNKFANEITVYTETLQTGG
ncbi:MAG: hypothetical protein J6Y02_20810 [Pseudobutyrivibrio sp.]|nr:hypothetical protein [Pseudobutyrivibrio sp.]